MKILIIEPYYTGSHKQWAEGYQKYSQHEIMILSMKGQFWKWRMHGGAVTLAKEYKKLDFNPDLILASDMLDLSTFNALIKTRARTAIYFHENQLSYPWSPNDRDIIQKRDHHYGFINYSSALVADHVFFNSKFHMNSFINDLHLFLKSFPDYNELNTINNIQEKSDVLYLGLELEKFDIYKKAHHNRPLILWNHRWEYDKNPDAFFSILKQIKNAKYDFDLAVLGENFNNSPNIFLNAKKNFKKNILHWGYVEDFNIYSEWLWKANIIPVTSKQDFFGASVMEAIYCNTYPLLPNRLSYPELIPNRLHEDLIYKNEEDLYKKIIQAIKNFNMQNFKIIRKAAKEYDWKFLAPIYDNKMESIL
tara:strand:- start:2217 stop:3305 length:1089 start_codon:yes stop_codon:yes gene_type:complete